MCVLDGINTWSLIRPGHESSVRKEFLGRLWMFFLGGRGGKRNRQDSTDESFSQDDTRFQTSPFLMLYFMYWSVEVSLMHASDHREKCPRPRFPG